MASKSRVQESRFRFSNALWALGVGLHRVSVAPVRDRCPRCGGGYSLKHVESEIYIYIYIYIYIERERERQREGEREVARERNFLWSTLNSAS